MKKNIVTTDDLLNYLKIPDFDSKENQEVVVKPITRERTYEEEFIPLRTFEITHREISLPRILYIDGNNHIYFRYRFSDVDIYYRPVLYEKSEAVYTEEQIPGGIEALSIPDDIFDGGYLFYINQENEIVASVQAVSINTSKNYLAYEPSNFSYLKEYPIVTYYYTNGYGVSANEKIKIKSSSRKGEVNRFPILTKTFELGYTYRLSYYYKEKEKELRAVRFLDEPPIAISLYFKNLTAVLSFLNKTIFWYYDEFNDYRSSWRNRFLKELSYEVISYLNSAGKPEKKAALIYHFPEPLYFTFRNTGSLWGLLKTLAKGYVRNAFGVNEEDLILKLLRIIYHRYTNKLRKTVINGKEKQEEETKNSIKQKDEFISNLITLKVDDQLLLHKLIIGLGGEQFKTYIRFIWEIWKGSSFSVADPKKNKQINITEKSPVLLDFRSGKILGFHADNAEVNWDGKLPKIELTVNTKVGTKEVPKLINIGEEKPIFIETKETETVDKYEKLTYSYHPFSPIVIENSENPKFIFKDEDTSNALAIKLPAFVLFANNEAAFWENVVTSGLYAVDAITTVSGVANILKAGRIYNLLKAGKRLLYKTAIATKVITGIKATAGVIEISSGTVNTLFKLTGINDTELGKIITKYLFYLEMISLAGEVSVALKVKLTKTAKNLVKNPKFVKAIDDLVKKGEIDKVTKGKIIDEIFTISEKARNVGKLTIKNEGIITIAKFNKIAKRIKKEYGVDMFLIDKNNRQWSELYKRWQKKSLDGFWVDQPLISKNYGVPVDGPALYLFRGLGTKGFERGLFEVTSYTVQHELFHMKMWLKVKEVFPNDFLKVFHKIPDEIHEAYVLSEFVKSRKFTKWDEADILDDLDSYNKNFRTIINQKELIDFEKFNLEEYLKNNL